MWLRYLDIAMDLYDDVDIIVKEVIFDDDDEVLGFIVNIKVLNSDMGTCVLSLDEMTYYLNKY